MLRDCQSFCILVQVNRVQWRFGRACDQPARRLESRAMTWAVPGGLGRVPMNDAAQMRADRGNSLDLASRIAMSSHAAAASLQNRPFSTFE